MNFRTLQGSIFVHAAKRLDARSSADLARIAMELPAEAERPDLARRRGAVPK